MPNFSKENEKIKQKIENEKQLTKSMVIYIGKYLLSYLVLFLLDSKIEILKNLMN